MLHQRHRLEFPRWNFQIVWTDKSELENVRLPMRKCTMKRHSKSKIKIRTSISSICLTSCNNDGFHGKSLGRICRQLSIRLVNVTFRFKHLNFQGIMSSVTSVSFFLLYFYYNAGRLLCWGFNCVYACQRGNVFFMVRQVFCSLLASRTWNALMLEVGNFN